MYSIQEIKQANKEAGQFFFSPDTMKFFASKIINQVWDGPNGVFFITSEKNGFDDPERVYTIRKFEPETANIRTVGDKFTTLNQAKKEAQRLSADYSK